MSMNAVLKALLCLGLVCAAQSNERTERRCEQLKTRFQERNCTTENLTLSCEWINQKIAKFCVDDCASAPCRNGATCVDEGTGFTCQCQAGYTGQTCDTVVKTVTCEDNVEAFACQCHDGKYTDIDDCASAPCENGATCVDQVRGFTCQCQAGYTGHTCNTDIYECASDPCENGATCVDQVNGFTCQCQAGYTGHTCDTDIDDCASAPCENGATCVGKLNGFTCQCQAGYIGDTCAEVDDCTSAPCENGATCVDQVNDFTCQCDEDHEGKTCADKKAPVCPHWWHSRDYGCSSGGVQCLGATQAGCHFHSTCGCDPGYLFNMKTECCETNCTFATITFEPYFHLNVSISVPPLAEPIKSLRDCKLTILNSPVYYFLIFHGNSGETAKCSLYGHDAAGKVAYTRDASSNMLFMQKGCN